MIRTLICALALSCSASVALACSAHTQQTQSCADGTYWDSETHTCAKIVDS